MGSVITGWDCQSPHQTSPQCDMRSRCSLIPTRLHNGWGMRKRHPSSPPHIQYFPAPEPSMASSPTVVPRVRALSLSTPCLPQGLAVRRVRRREEVSQLLTEMGMGGKRNEIRGQRAQGLQRSSRKEPGPSNVEKTDMTNKSRGVWMVPVDQRTWYW